MLKANVTETITTDTAVRPSYFIQITEITNEKFTLRFDENAAIKQYAIQDMETNSHELGKVSILSRSGTHDIYFEKEHDENYKISLNDQNYSANTQQPFSYIVSISKYPSNMNYP
eukprot:432562_1